MSNLPRTGCRPHLVLLAYSGIKHHEKRTHRNPSKSAETRTSRSHSITNCNATVATTPRGTRLQARPAASHVGELEDAELGDQRGSAAEA
jgi:hypothetical protein